MIRQMYQIQRAPRSEYVPIRTLQYHVQVWGQPAAHKIPLVMVHGWMDVAASYQFVVDALPEAFVRGSQHHRTRLARLRTNRRQRG